jgi:post-segregation antitoxin (ccd killing protein)
VPRRSSGAAKCPTNVAVPIELRNAARAAGVNLSALLERAITEELRERRGRAWRLENARAIEGYNAHIKEHGVLGDPRWCF